MRFTVRLILGLMLVGAFSTIADAQAITSLRRAPRTRAQAAQGYTYTHPNIWMNQTEIDAMKARIVANADTTITAYNNLINSYVSGGENWMALTPPSVTYQENPTSPYDEHDYYNPKVDWLDYNALWDFTRAVRDLALMWQITGNSTYAEKAIDYFEVWCYNGSTKMYSHRENVTSQTSSDVGQMLPAGAYALDLLYNYSGWNQTVKDSVISWFSEYAYTQKTEQETHLWTNNWRSALAGFIGSAGVLSEDDVLLDFAFDQIYDMIETDIVGPTNALLSQHVYGTEHYQVGMLYNDINHPSGRGLSYDQFGVSCYLKVAELGLRQSPQVDLYSYTATSDGATIKQAVEFILPYVVAPNTWPYSQTYSGTGYWFDAWGDCVDTYQLVVGKWTELDASMNTVLGRDYSSTTATPENMRWRFIGRPQYDIRSLGPTTLTHYTE